MSVEVGTAAPDFELRSQFGEHVTLAELQGSRVALIFYAFAFSGICAEEMQKVRDDIATLAGDDVEVLGISCDAMFTQRAFAEAERLDFRLLSDHWPHGEVARRYGVFDEDAGASVRATFIIDETGVVGWKERRDIDSSRDFADCRRYLVSLPRIEAS